MRARINGKQNSAWLTAALWLALAVLGLLHFGGVGVKWMTLLAGIGVIALLVLGDRKRIWNLPSLLLLGYAAFSWVTIFWAMSGKFHLREGSKLLIAVFFFLLVAMHKKFDGAFARRVMGAIAGISAIYALLSIEAVSTGLTKTPTLKRPSTPSAFSARSRACAERRENGSAFFLPLRCRSARLHSCWCSAWVRSPASSRRSRRI